MIGTYTYNLTPILKQLGPNLKSLQLSWVPLSVFQLERLLDHNPALQTSLNHLSLGMISSTGTMSRMENFKLLLNLISNQLTSLQFLDILMADQLPLVELVPILSRVPNLEELWLYIGCHQLGGSRARSLEQLHRLPRLTTVKSVYLEIYDLSIWQFCTWISHLFPNVQKLKVKCDYEAKTIAKLKEWARKEFKQLERFSTELL